MNLPPNGPEEWAKAYGVAENNEQWRAENLTRITLPFALRVAWDKTKFVTRIWTHHYCAEAFQAVFDELDRRRLAVYVTEFGGTYAYRKARGSGKLSTHSWAAAIDLNPETNQLGTGGDMRREVIDVFEGLGFTWGGKWTRPDPMHFQYGKEYS